MQSPISPFVKELALCRQELDLKLQEHMIALLRGDRKKALVVRDEALSKFYESISAAETAALAVRKLEG